MKNDTRLKIWYFVFSLLMLQLAACGTLEVGVEQGMTAAPANTAETFTTIPPATVTGESAATPLASSPAPTEEMAAAVPTPADQPVSPLWATYRDPASGFGYAYPCYWLNQVPTLVSYDEPFFMDHGIRGQWIDGSPPEGAVKIEFGVFKYADNGIAPGTSLEEAIPLAISDTIISTEEVILGSFTALRVELEGSLYPEDGPNEIYFFQPAPDSMLMLSVAPRKALASADVQAILDSLSLSGDEAITIPSVDPAGPLEGRAVYFNEEAGYCFQYPAEYTLEAFAPSGIPYLGDIASLKLERPFYTTGLTATALRVGQDSTLEEQVTNFINGLPEGAAAEVERNPLSRVGGVDFRVGGEPAEFLEGVPGAEGSREIFVKHANRIYRLSFIPAVSTNPQAEPDLESLFQIVTTSVSFLPMED